MNIYFVIQSTRLSLNRSRNLSLFDIERIASQVEPRDQGLEITNSCHYQLEYSRKPKVSVLVYQLQFLILFLLVLFLTTSILTRARLSLLETRLLNSQSGTDEALPFEPIIQVLSVKKVAASKGPDRYR